MNLIREDDTMKMKLPILLIISLLTMTSCGNKPEEPVIEQMNIHYGVEIGRAHV